MKVLFLGSAQSPSWPGGEGNLARILRPALIERGLGIQAAWLERAPTKQRIFNPSSSPMSIANSEVVDSYRRCIVKKQPDVVITSFDYDLSAVLAGIQTRTPTIVQALSPWPVCPKDDLFISRKQIRCDGPNLACGQCMIQLSENRPINEFASTRFGLASLSALSAMKIKKIKRMISTLNSASAIVSDNLFLKKKMEQIGYNPSKIRLIYNGVDLNKSKPVGNEQKNKEKTVLFLAYQPTEHRRALKGCHHFVQLARKLKPEFPDVRFLWVGQQQGQSKDSFETKSYIWDDQELQETYRSCYLLLLPSLWPETISYAAQEVMAHGKPVVAYDTGANKEITIHKETGLLAEWGNIEQLTSYVRTLLLDEKEAERMGNNGRTLAQTMFGIDQMADSYERLIEEVSQTSTKSSASN
jgi:glycosyltransferase involved in cell wall biosynthesis